ncbi:MAG: energy transducer TonB, partial [Deltaproteobacteria bacterium]|nr:energy transducer TonB [Deltaproteobacteria bacterium]
PRASAPAGAEVSLGGSQVTGTLDRAVIERVIRSHVSGIRACYERVLADIPGLEGRVVIRFVIGADGNVTAAAVEESTLNNSAVEACVVAQFRRMKFPEPEGGGVVVVNYPLVFTAE